MLSFLFLVLFPLIQGHFGFYSTLSNSTFIQGSARYNCTGGATPECDITEACELRTVPNPILGPTLNNIVVQQETFVFNMRQGIAHLASEMDPTYSYRFFEVNNGVVGNQVGDTIGISPGIGAGSTTFASPALTFPSTPGQYLLSVVYDANEDYWGCLDFLIVAAQAPSDLLYSFQSLVFQVNEQFISQPPTVNDGFDTVTYSAAELPAGVSLDPDTGILTVQRTTVLNETLITINATNSQGFTQTSFTLEILNTTAPTISYPTTQFALETGQTFTDLTPTLGGDPVQMDGISVSPALPLGIEIDPNTGVISGVASAVIPTTTFTVTALNAGGMGTAAIEITVSDPVSSNNDLPPILGENCVLFDFPVEADGVQRRAALSWTIEDDDTVFFQIVKPSVASGYLGFGINPTEGGCTGGCMGQSEFIIFQDNNLVQNEVRTFTRVGIDGNPGVAPQPDDTRRALLQDVQMSSANNVFTMSFRRPNTGFVNPLFIDRVQTFLIAFREGDLLSDVSDPSLDAYHGGNGRVRMDIVLSNPTQPNNCNELGFADPDSTSAASTLTISIFALAATFLALF